MKILLVDDHPMFRDGMKHILTDLDENLEFSDAGTFEQAIASLTADGADLILLDLVLPDATGLTALRHIRGAFPAIPVAIVSNIEDPERICELIIDEGASGYVPKSSSIEAMKAALKLILAGGVYLPVP